MIKLALNLERGVSIPHRYAKNISIEEVLAIIDKVSIPHRYAKNKC